MSPCIAFYTWHFFLLKIILISLYADFYILKFLSYLHPYLFHYVLVFNLLVFTLLFLWYLHWQLYNHLFRFRHWHFNIIYTDTSFIKYLFSHIDTFIILALIPFLLCIEFDTLTFFCYLHLYLFHHILNFTNWRFYFIYSYTYFIM